MKILRRNWYMRDWDWMYQIGYNVSPNICIIYLHSLIKRGNGVFDAYVDFFSERDLWTFVHYLQLNIHDWNYGPTFLALNSLKSSKRLIEGSYYQLNLEQLRKYRYETVENSYVIALAFNLIEMQSPENERFELLQKHASIPNQYYRHWYVEKSDEDDVLPQFCLHNPKIVVRDVGQANWNEIWEDKRLDIVYDIGVPLCAKRIDVDRLVNQSEYQLLKDKPLLIISHWDLDHVHGLLALFHKGFDKFFSGLICVNAMKSLTAKRIFEQFYHDLNGINVYCLRVLPKTSRGANEMRLVSQNKNKTISLYQGEANRNINYSGLSMFVKGVSASVIFTGDMKLSQAKNVYDQELSFGILSKEHILIVPHHGGDTIKVNRRYSYPCTEAIISVGPNHYGHPAPCMLKYLMNLTRGNVTRTNIQGDVVRSI